MNSCARFFILYIFVAIFGSGCSSSSRIHNVPQTILFSSLSGDQLLDSLQANYKPEAVLRYNATRDLMFSQIYNENGKVICIYTGDTLIIDPGTDSPRTFAYYQGWSTEHIYPQSKGASVGKARSDLHHLYPVRSDVNSSRSNYPFTFMEDKEVTRWWKYNHSSDSIPEGSLSAWSKTKSSPAPSLFEVRDGSKGNAARAMFYFYTVYRDKANSDYFINQMEVLLKYHDLDPIDYHEFKRTVLIADVQDGKVNPFIIDTTLVRRAFSEYEQ
ncbi:MAG: endonuclease [Balneolales bacterium]